MRTITSCPLFKARRADSQPILGVFAGCCASAEETAVSRKVANSQTTPLVITLAPAFF
jgi:hypothetical protein